MQELLEEYAKVLRDIEEADTNKYWISVVLLKTRARALESRIIQLTEENESLK